MLFQVEPFASLVTLSRLNVPRVLLNREPVGPFRSQRSRLTDVTVCGDVVEGVRQLAQGAGWGEDLDNLHRQITGETPPNDKCMETNTYYIYVYVYILIH